MLVKEEGRVSFLLLAKRRWTAVQPTHHYFNPYPNEKSSGRRLNPRSMTWVSAYWFWPINPTDQFYSHVVLHADISCCLKDRPFDLYLFVLTPI